MLTVRTLHKQNEQYALYRIPGIVITAAGTLLTYYEARRAPGNDWAPMDILLYRSEDGGETWAGPTALAQGTDEYHTVNNPVCIVGRNGRLHFLYCRDYSINGGDVFYRYSEDDGCTWSEPVNIMAATRPEFHNAFALGPCHGICKTDSTLLVPVWMVAKAEGQPLTAHHPAVVSTLFSRDDGTTWQLGEILPATKECPDPSESQAAQLPDGRIYLNARLTRAGYRASAVSGTGFDGWTPFRPERTLIDPTCCGSITTVRYTDSAGDVHPLLLSVNCAHTSERKNLVCRASEDGGRTWPYALTVEPGDAGYADIAASPDGTVYVLYEQKFGIQENLAKFTLQDLLGV